MDKWSTQVDQAAYLKATRCGTTAIAARRLSHFTFTLTMEKFGHKNYSTSIPPTNGLAQSFAEKTPVKESRHIFHGTGKVMLETQIF